MSNFIIFKADKAYRVAIKHVERQSDKDTGPVLSSLTSSTPTYMKAHECFELCVVQLANHPRKMVDFAVVHTCLLISLWSIGGYSYAESKSVNEVWCCQFSTSRLDEVHWMLLKKCSLPSSCQSQLGLCAAQRGWGDTHLLGGSQDRQRNGRCSDYHGKMDCGTLCIESCDLLDKDVSWTKATKKKDDYYEHDLVLRELMEKGYGQRDSEKDKLKQLLDQHWGGYTL